MPYPHSDIESKWQKYWSEHDTFACLNPEIENNHKPKFYALDMFPYPSGAGLHVGHPKGYTATDIIARYKHAKGFNVLHPMGWDAFGLPAENYAIKTGTHPAVTTAKNIDHFREQLQKFGFSFDWNREVNTTDPEYFRWSQWIFLKLFEAGLAYESDKPINFCPSCKTGLANEEVIDGKCERCSAVVEKKPIRQWVLAITKYADRLLSDIDRLDWPEGIKEMQRNWIGKSEGCQFFFRGIDCPDVEVFTTRIDTVYSGAFIVIAPDHPRVNEYIHADQKAACDEYINQTREETDIERTNAQKEKTGVFTGSYAINPYDGSELPIWIGDFVLGHYGTGAVFGDAHDERDFVFAQKYNIPLKESVCQKFITTGDRKAKEDVETLKRKVVAAIIENQQGEFLLLKEIHELGESFIFTGGGIEEGETEIEALKKEIVEETGYTNFEIVEPIFGTHSGGLSYRVPKKKNQDVVGRFFHVKVHSEKRVHSEADDGQHQILWCKKDEVGDMLSSERHKFAWNIFTQGAKAFTDDGILINSGEHDGLTSGEARKVLTEKAEKEGFGKKVVNYKLRDWIFSRQRYWGEPIPLIHIPLETSELCESGCSTDAIYHGSSCILEDAHGRFYFQRRSETKKFPNELAFFGGGAETGETSETTIRRELLEELELELDAGQLHFICHGPTIAGKDGVASLFYAKIRDDQIPTICHEGCIETHLYDTIEELDMLPGIRRQWENFVSWRSGNTSSVPTLRFRDSTILDAILSGDKTIETRALNPEEPERYFGNIKNDDVVIFSHVEKQEKILVKIKKVTLWKNLHFLAESMKEYPEEKFGARIFGEDRIFTEKELQEKYSTLSDRYAEKIDNNGLIGFEFEVIGKLYRGIDSWILPDYTLPLKLPEVERYEPSGDGQSPLATIPDWVNVRLGNNLVGKRETNTMPQWAGSCWYYLRYMDPRNSEVIVDPAIVKYWGEVDSYIGGAEHAVLHLLYARFWHKFLFDIGVVPSDEPFFKLRNVGLILGPDGEKMSKSRGNVINPDEVISEYGADTLRMYEMSMADFSDVSPWNTKAIIGSYRLLERIHRLFTTDETSTEFQTFLANDDMKAIKTMHKAIKKVGEDIENMKFNTAISMLNVMMNEGAPRDIESREEWKSALVRLLHPFAPHIAEECWTLSGNVGSIYEAEWPEYVEALTVDDEVMIAVQINGKLRGTYAFMRGVTAEEVRMTVEQKPEIAKWLADQEIVKEIFIPNKILNIVVK